MSTRPSSHICPITHDVMMDPVVAGDGHTYERAAITHWLSTHHNSPMTRQDLRRHRDLHPNIALRAMINDWRSTSASVRSVSQLKDRSPDEMFKTVTEEVDRRSKLLEDMGARGRDIVVFLGNTGCGKSTLVNFLAGKELQVVDGGNNYELVDSTDPEAMVIGLTGRSETLRPKSIDVGELRFFDLPGFQDTDGSERNLVNAAFVKRIILEAKSVRLVFVAGHDQFTADRGKSMKHMFESINRLFVAHEGINLVEKGILVVTKLAANSRFDLKKNLLQLTTDDNTDLPRQIQRWHQRGALKHTYAAVFDGGNDGNKRREIISCIRGMEPERIFFLNIDQIYPPETREDLQRMFAFVMEDRWEKKQTKEMGLRHLAEINDAIDDHRRPPSQCWESFIDQLCKEAAVGLIKEFSDNPFNAAKSKFHETFEADQKRHLKALFAKRDALIADIKRRTEARTDVVVAEITPGEAADQDGTSQSPLTFAVHHKDYYNGVCGADVIKRLASEPAEQELVKKFCSDHLKHRSRSNMDTWLNASTESMRTRLDVAIPAQAGHQREIDTLIPTRDRHIDTNARSTH